MANGISPIRVTYGEIKVRNYSYKAAFLEKKEGDKTYKMTVKFHDRNDDGELNNLDAVQFGVETDSAEDRKHFSNEDLAAAQDDIFAKCTDDGDADENTRDTSDVHETRQNGKLVSINLGSTPIKLGVARAALIDLGTGKSSNGGQGAQGTAQGGQGGQGAAQGGNAPQFGGLTVPNITPALAYTYNTALCGATLLGGDFDMTAVTACRNIDNALSGLFGAWASSMNVPGANGGGYTPSGSTGSPDSAGSNPTENNAAKAEEVAKKAKEAEKAAKEARDKKIAEAKAEKEKEISPIVDELFKAMKGTGTDNGKLLETVNKIKEDNVIEILEAWEKSHSKEMKEENGKDYKSLIELIADETGGLFSSVIGSSPEEYLKPIQTALVNRSKSQEAEHLSVSINVGFKSFWTWNREKAGERIQEIYDLVKKEETAHPEKAPLVMAVDAKIKEENDKKAADKKQKLADDKKAKDAEQAKADAKKAHETSVAQKIKELTGDKEFAKAFKEENKRKPTAADIAKVAEEKVNDAEKETIAAENRKAADRKTQEDNEKTAADKKATDLKAERDKATKLGIKFDENTPIEKLRKDNAEKEAADAQKPAEKSRFQSITDRINSLRGITRISELERDANAPAVTQDKAPKADKPAEVSNPEKDAKVAACRAKYQEYQKAVANQASAPHGQLTSLLDELLEIEKQLKVDFNLTPEDIKKIES